MLRSAGSAPGGRGVYYGWVIVAIGFTMMAVTFGIQYSFGVFFKPLQDTFGWSRAATSMAATLHIVVFGLSVLPVAWVIERIGYRRVYIAAAILVGAALLLCSRVTEQWQLYLVYGLPAAVGLSVVGPTTVGLIPRWFIKRRGIALGINSAGSGFGTLVGAPLSNALINSYGWRNALAIIAVGGCLILLICAAFMRRPPEALPESHSGKNAEAAPAPAAIPASMSLGQAIRTKEMALILLAHAVSSLAVRMNMVHIAPYARDIGISPSLAALAVGAIGGASVLGRLGMGAVQDRIGAKTSLIFCLVTQGVAMLALPLLASDVGFFVYAVVFGFVYGGDVPQIPALTARAFGLASMGAVWAVVAMAGNVTGAFGPVAAGLAFDLTGSYAIVFVGTAICLLAMALLFGRFRTGPASLSVAPRRESA